MKRFMRETFQEMTKEEIAGIIAAAGITLANVFLVLFILKFS